MGATRIATKKTYGQMNADGAVNMEVQDVPSQEGQSDGVMESMGMAHDEAHEPEAKEGEHSNETLQVQKRLKAQKRAHERETRDLHARISDLEARMSQPNTIQQPQMGNAPMQGQPMGMNGAPGVSDQVQQAVSYALQQKDAQERAARDRDMKAHVMRQYGELQNHLDNMGDKYDDFHDTVMANNTPFTEAMRDYSLTLPKSGAGSAGEVLYKLGKNPEELDRISKLHPLEQAKEMMKLSHALISGGEQKGTSAKPPLGNIKSNPIVNSREISDKTPISEIRARMKAGWK